MLKLSIFSQWTVGATVLDGNYAGNPNFVSSARSLGNNPGSTVNLKGSDCSS